MRSHNVFGGSVLSCPYENQQAGFSIDLGGIGGADMTTKSIKLFWEEKDVRSGNVLKILFGDRRETIDAAKLLIKQMQSDPHLAMTKHQMRIFAKELEKGKGGVRYSYHNFYVKLLRKLLDLGFIEKDVLIWDQKRRKTEAVYQLKLQAVSGRAPQGGFIKQAWMIAKGWNELVRS